MAGARWGASGISTDWRQKLVAGERITALARGLFAAGGGRVDSHGWPYDEFLHAWWVEPGRLLAGEFPGHVEAGGAAEKVNLLVDAGIRTFVDLTAPGDPLTPYEPIVAKAAADRRLDVRHVPFPIPDVGVVEDDRYDDVIAVIDEAQGRGGVYVHCRGGVGRTGTVIGCVLGARGAGYDEVVQRLATLRAGTRKAGRSCPEMPAQHEVLRRRLG